MAQQLPHNNRYDIACVSTLRAESLSQYQQVFFVAATYSDGEPPEQPTNCGKSWLIMGERSPADDYYFDQQLSSFECSGTLNKRQHAWSNNIDSDQAKYVGDTLTAEQDEIRHWLLVLNAHLYICGSAATLGVSCDAILTDIVGSRMLG